MQLKENGDDNTIILGLKDALIIVDHNTGITTKTRLTIEPTCDSIFLRIGY